MAARWKLGLILTTLVTGVTFASLFSGQYTQAQEEDLTLNQDHIRNKVHLNKLKTFNGNPNSAHQYVEKLNTKEVFEAAAELSNASEVEFVDNALVFVPTLKRRWSNGLPHKELDKLIKDKKNNKHFRAFLIDTETSLQSTPQEDDVTQTLLDVSLDKTEDASLRRFAVLNMKKVSKNMTRLKKQDIALQTLFQDQTNPPEVRGAAITAMHRLISPDFKKAVDAVMSTPEQHPGILVRHAMAEGVKSGHLKDVSKLRKIAENTKDAEVYATAIYALGMEKNVAAVHAIVGTYGRHNNPDIAVHALLQNERTILSMLHSDASESDILTGIRAAQIIKLPAFLPALQTVENGNSSESIRKQAQEARISIQNQPPSDTPFNSNKWED